MLNLLDNLSYKPVFESYKRYNVEFIMYYFDLMGTRDLFLWFLAWFVSGWYVDRVQRMEPFQLQVGIPARNDRLKPQKQTNQYVLFSCHFRKLSVEVS